MTYKYIVSAIQKAAKNHRGGITSVALTMGKNPNILANKLNTNTNSHALTLEEAAEIIKITQNKETIEALATLINATVVDLPKSDVLENSKLNELLETFILTNKKCAALGEEIIQASSAQSAGGEKINSQEIKAINIELNSLIQGVLKIRLLLEQNNQLDSSLPIKNSETQTP